MDPGHFEPEQEESLSAKCVKPVKVEVWKAYVWLPFVSSIFNLGKKIQIIGYPLDNKKRPLRIEAYFRQELTYVEYERIVWVCKEGSDALCGELAGSGSMKNPVESD